MTSADGSLSAPAFESLRAGDRSDLAAAALDGLRRASYRAATEGTKAVSSTRTLRIRFQLTGGDVK